MIILGIHDGHNSSAALLIDGSIAGAVQEERFTRLKNHYCFPTESINWLLMSNSIQPDEVTRVVLCNYHTAKGSDRESLKAAYRRSQSLSTKIKMAVYRKTLAGTFYRRRRKGQRIQSLLELRFRRSQIVFGEHHLMHANAAYFGNGQFNEKVLVLTVDGQGDNLCGTVNIGENGTITRIVEIPQSESFGNMYGMITYIMGMVPLEHEYKVMGLAPYASEATFERGKALFSGLFEVPEGSLVWKRRKLPPALSGYQSYRKFLEAFRFDVIAAGVQWLVEEIMTRWVQNCIEHTGIRNIALSGGVGMNVKANMRIAAIPEVESFFIMPSAGDESNPIGACYGQFVLEGGALSDVQPLAGLYLGPTYSPDKVMENLDESKYTVTPANDPYRDVGKMIADGEIVALCDGPTEFGARALGNRTIVADPSKQENVRTINDMIKRRDFWMPFAPSIMSEHEEEFIVNPKKIPAPYMILTFNSTDRRMEIVAALHRYDMTTRPQIVYKDWNPNYHRLISTFEQQSGIGAVLNTSFNLHGLPIVNNTEDAMLVMENSGLKHLLVEGHILSKRE